MFFSQEFDRIKEQQSNNSDNYAFYTTEGKDHYSNAYITNIEFKKTSENTQL